MPVIASPADLERVPQLLDEGGDEFCACENLQPEMVAAACRAGFLPMGLELPELPLLLVKSHHHRAVLNFQRLHVQRNVRRYARDLSIFVNRHFSDTIDAVVETHGDGWLIPPLVAAFTALHQHPCEGVQTHSVEVYHGETFVAGEVGYCSRGVYTSLSGFHRPNGAGTVQMVALAALLRAQGVRFWDLGMEAAYKLSLGAEMIPRREFLAFYHSGEAVSDTVAAVGCHALPRGPNSCADLVEEERKRIVSSAG
jgi:Leu/Phe-tRNA-protein transferase